MKGPAGSLVGKWQGQMSQSGSSDFDTLIEIEEDGDLLKGRIIHSTLDCSGELSFIKNEANYYKFYQVISKGKDRCYDGLNEIIMINETTIKRSWFHDSHKLSSTGTLKRIE
jgi:hypothetical protein